MNEQVHRPVALFIDDIRCRAPVNSDGSQTHIRIDWSDGHEILVRRADAALLRDWLIKVLTADPPVEPEEEEWDDDIPF